MRTLCWQQVEVEEETEEERIILAALRDLGKKVRAPDVAKAIGSQRTNTSSRLQELWKQGKVRMDVIHYVPHYYLKEQDEPEAQNA